MNSIKLNKSIRAITSRLPLSQKLAFGYGLSLLVLLSGFGFLLLEIFHLAIHENYDMHLRFEANELIKHIEISNEAILVDTLEINTKESLGNNDIFATYVRIFNRNQVLIFQSLNFEGIAEPLVNEFPTDTTKIFVSNNWLSQPSRSLFYPIINNNQHILGWLEVTGFEWSLHEDLNSFRLNLFLLIVLGVAFAVITSYWLTKLALFPINSILNTAKSITATDLDKRIPIQNQVKDELTDLTETFNMMLSRLQKSFEREKRFTSDAAHELLTPFSTLRNDAEIILRKQRTTEEYKNTIERMLIEVKRLIRMVGLLLQLSKIESVFMPESELINISKIIEIELGKWTKTADKKNIRLHAQITPDLLIQFQESYATEVINNLLDNAIKYSTNGSKIYVKLLSDSSQVFLQVTDTGIGFDDRNKTFLFERFYRVDDPTVQKQSGSGLGLSLIKAILEAYNGNIQASSDGPNKGSTFIVRLPLHVSD